MSTSYATERIGDQYMAAVAPTSTVLSKTFVLHGWNQKMVLIAADQQITVSIMYTFQTDLPPRGVEIPDAEFLVLTTAKNVVLPANEIIPYGVEDPVHYVKVRVETGGNPTNVKILVLGSR
jgi:hypothetical protein